MMCQWTVFNVAYSLRSAYTRPMSDLKTRQAGIFLREPRRITLRWQKTPEALGEQPKQGLPGSAMNS